MTDPDDYDLPPHRGYWPDRFLVNAEYVNGLTYVWRTIPNDGVKVRAADGLLHVKRDDTIVSYSLTPSTYLDTPIYISERQEDAQ